jgi:LPS sulfotransferase NodH
VAEEVFNAPTVQEHGEREKLRSLYDYINFLEGHLSMSGWLAAKLGIEQLVMLTEAGIFDEIIGRTKFILIERQDKVAQAISRLVALQNGAWTSRHASRMADERLVYSREAIDAERAIIAFQNHAFYRFFASNNVTPKHIAYETLLESPERLLVDIGAWLGFPRFTGHLAAVGIERQESPVKRAWRERYERGE